MAAAAMNIAATMMTRTTIGLNLLPISSENMALSSFRWLEIRGCRLLTLCAVQLATADRNV